MSEESGRSPTLKKSTWWLIVIIIACLSVGLWGWSDLAQSKNLSATDVIYHSLSALWLSDGLSRSAEWGGDWRIEAARWLGVLAFVIGATKAMLALLSTRWSRYRARSRMRHDVVIGNTELARGLANHALDQGRTVHWGEAPLGIVDEAHPDLFVDTEPFGEQSCSDLAVPDARLCAVAMSNDTEAMAVARRIKAHGACPSLLINLRSPWLGLHIDKFEGMENLRLFSEAQIAVRAVQRRHPPFLLAKAQQHQKLHIVIVGFGETGEAVLIESLLSSITQQYRKPIITIIDPQDNRVRHHLKLRYPELEKSVDLRFVSGSVEGHKSPLSPGVLSEVAKPDPISTAYVCLRDPDHALATALVLKALAQREELTSGPIHVRQVSSRALLQPPVGASRLTAGELIPFGSTEQVIDELGLAAQDPDRLARSFHEAYVEAAPDSKPGSVPWDQLSEDMKDSNRRLVLHIPAKLSSVGVDVDAWLNSASDDLPLQWPVLGELTDQQLEQMAILEHERWMADRRLNGWQWGKTRNDEARRHPDLVPFSELPESSRNYDRTMVQELVEVLQRR